MARRDKTIHYLDDIGGCGLSATLLVTESFRACLFTNVRLLRAAMDAGLEEMMVALLDVWSLDYRLEDQVRARAARVVQMS